MFGDLPDWRELAATGRWVVARFYEADCRRKGRFWLIEVSGWAPREGDFKVGVTQARVFRREIEPMARDLIEVETGETGVELSVWGDDLIPAVYRRRWQWHWPWMISRPWRPGVGRGSDEFCNRSLMITLPLLGMLVAFYRPGRMRTAGDGPCAECLVWDERDRAAGWKAVP